MSGANAIIPRRPSTRASDLVQNMLRNMVHRASRWLGARDRRDNRPATKRLGDAGERLAARFLEQQGYRVLGRNVRTRSGEADVVCLAPDGGTIVVVEVKTRLALRGDSQGASGRLVAPEQNVTPDKQRTLARIVRTLRRANRWSGRAMRIDIVAVEWPGSASETETGEPGGTPTIRHWPGAVPLRERR
ncbi:MAG: YraN family protein [Planctomycetota bacterium]|nr:YraN family protein [Planctomycetota bacterium]